MVGSLKERVTSVRVLATLLLLIFAFFLYKQKVSLFMGQPWTASIHPKASNLNHAIKVTEVANYYMHIQLLKDQKKQNISFSLLPNSLQNQSICLVSMHEYYTGEMKQLNFILSKHKKDFAAFKSMSYVDINPESYRKLYPNLSSTWLKLPAIYDLMLNDSSTHNYDWFMWVDADVCFTNNSCTFQNLLSIHHNVVVAGDFNTGVFLIKNNKWSLRFLQAWFSLWPRLLTHTGAEDAALYHIIFEQKRWNPYIHDLNENGFRTIASYPLVFDYKSAWHPGDCILHAAGFSDDKASILTACLKSEYDCVKRLNKLYVKNGGSSYLPYSSDKKYLLKRVGY